jgi:hypothetical protein
MGYVLLYLLFVLTILTGGFNGRSLTFIDYKLLNHQQ